MLVFGGGGSGGNEESASIFGIERAVAVDALDFDGSANFSVEFSISVDILDEVAIDAVHAFFEMDIEHVHGDIVFFREQLGFELADLFEEYGVGLCPVDLSLEILSNFGDSNGFLAVGWGGFRKYFAGVINGNSGSIFPEDSLEHPSMSVEI